MQNRSLLATGCFLMFVAVAAGAFGAHGLKSVLSSDMLAIWQTAVLYQMIHSLGVIAVGLALLVCSDELAVWLKRCAYLMLVGMGLFCGSLYALAYSELRWLGAITPLGGVAFLAAWLTMTWAFFRKSRVN